MCTSVNHEVDVLVPLHARDRDASTSPLGHGGRQVPEPGVCATRAQVMQGLTNIAAVRPKPCPAPRAGTSSARLDLIDALSRASRGDQQAFAQVYAATSAKLYGIIVRIVRRRDVADDILQEVYVRVWQRAADFDPAHGSPISWLAMIARNRALDEIKRKTMRSLDDCPEVLQLPGDDDPLADLEHSEDRQRLGACLDRLAPDKREVLLLVYHHGMTREEVASRLGRPVSTVKTWLRRSLAQIKDHLAE